MPTRDKTQAGSHTHRHHPAAGWVCCYEALDVCWGAVYDAQPLLKGLLQVHGTIHGLQDMHGDTWTHDHESHARMCWREQLRDDRSWTQQACLAVSRKSSKAGLLQACCSYGADTCM